MQPQRSLAAQRGQAISRQMKRWESVCRFLVSGCFALNGGVGGITVGGLALGNPIYGMAIGAFAFCVLGWLLAGLVITPITAIVNALLTINSMQQSIDQTLECLNDNVMHEMEAAMEAAR